MDQPKTESELIETEEVPTPSVENEPLLSYTEDAKKVEAVEDDGEEIDYEGEKYKVPAKLKEAFLRQADYTRKTQEVAEARRAIEQQAAEVQQRAQFNQQHVQDVAKVMAIDEQLQKFSKLDIDALIDADPVQAMKLQRQIGELQQQRQQSVQRISEIQQRTALESQQATARQLQEAKAVVEREINGWSPELVTKLQDTAKSIGFKAEELNNITDPRAVKLLHKAYLYDQLVKERSKAPEAEPAKPVTRITPAKSSAVTNPDKLSADDWLKWRNQQLRKK